MRVLVSWSGGKNSTRAVMEHLKIGNNVTCCCYIPYFDDDIPLIDKAHFDFILRTANFFESLGCTVVFVRGVSYYDWCMRILTKGAHKGEHQCFPYFARGKCGFARDSKIRSINNYLRSVKSNFDCMDIGLCADELDRKKLSGFEISILQSLGITDLDCFNYCKDHNLLSPKYLTSSRDGCLLCPNAKNTERVKFLQEYPQAREKLLYLQSISRERGLYPLRGKRWFIENDDFIGGNGSNVSIFGEIIN